jgi:7-keto-8-aminopelargonate synthetase-like enzyme
VVAAGAGAAVARASRDAELRQRALARAARLRDLFLEAGLTPPVEALPWFTVRGDDAESLAAASADLFERGFQVPPLRYHGAPAQGVLRVAVSAAHSPEQIDELGDALPDVVKRHGLS